MRIAVELIVVASFAGIFAGIVFDYPANILAGVFLGWLVGSIVVIKESKPND